MRTFASIKDSEEAVANTLQQLRKRLERSLSQENILSHTQRVEIYNRYASYELLSHWLAYRLTEEFDFGYTLCKVLDDDGTARYYHPIKLLTQNRGLLGFFLIPYDETNQNSRIHIVFVGT